MSGNRASIGQLMMVVALVAVNLAIVRATPWGVVNFPTIWVVMGILDFLIEWKLILRRSFRAFHYTFLIVLLVSFFVLANLVATERIHPLGPFVRLYQHLSNEPGDLRSIAGYISLAEIWSTAFLGAALACAAGFVAGWLERRRAWDIAAFWRGALIGVVIGGLLATIDDAAHGWAVPEAYSIEQGRRILIQLVCLFLGGLMGLSKLKSSKPVAEDRVR
jgi:hypothetical protein